MSSQEQPEDQTPADETVDEEPSATADDDHDDDNDGDDDGGGDDDDTPPTDDERLEQLSERIEKARTQAEDAGVLTDTDDDNPYVDSGATEGEDDQTITPPG